MYRRGSTRPRAAPDADVTPRPPRRRSIADAPERARRGRSRWSPVDRPTRSDAHPRGRGGTVPAPSSENSRPSWATSMRYRVSTCTIFRRNGAERSDSSRSSTTASAEGTEVARDRGGHPCLPPCVPLRGGPTELRSTGGRAGGRQPGRRRRASFMLPGRGRSRGPAAGPAHSRLPSTSLRKPCAATHGSGRARAGWGWGLSLAGLVAGFGPEVLLYAAALRMGHLRASVRQVTVRLGRNPHLRVPRRLRLADAGSVVLLAASRRPQAGPGGASRPPASCVFFWTIPVGLAAVYLVSFLHDLVRASPATGDRRRVPAQHDRRHPLRDPRGGDGAAVRRDLLPRLPLPRLLVVVGVGGGGPSSRRPSSALRSPATRRLRTAVRAGVSCWPGSTSAPDRCGRASAFHALFNGLSVLAWALTG